MLSDLRQYVCSLGCLTVWLIIAFSWRRHPFGGPPGPRTTTAACALPSRIYRAAARPSSINRSKTKVADLQAISIHCFWPIPLVLCTAEKTEARQRAFPPFHRNSNSTNRRHLTEKIHIDVYTITGGCWLWRLGKSFYLRPQVVNIRYKNKKIKPSHDYLEVLKL
jgi:hypothetical protein